MTKVIPMDMDDLEDVEDYSSNYSDNQNKNINGYRDDDGVYDHDQLPTPEEMKLRSNFSSYSSRTRSLRMMLACLAVGVVLIFLVAAGGHKKKTMSGKLGGGQEEARDGRGEFFDVPHGEEPIHDVTKAMNKIVSSFSTDHSSAPELDEILDDRSLYQSRAYYRVVNDKSIDNGVYHYDRLQQRYALYCLYFSTNNPTFNNTSTSLSTSTWIEEKGWKRMGMDECDWYGVMCDTNGYVTRIGLRDNGLTGEFPPEIALIPPKLQVLNLNSNQDMSGSVPKDVCDRVEQSLDIKVDCSSVECDCCSNC